MAVTTATASVATTTVRAIVRRVTPRATAHISAMPAMPAAIRMMVVRAPDTQAASHSPIASGAPIRAPVKPPAASIAHASGAHSAVATPIGLASPIMPTERWSEIHGSPLSHDRLTKC